MKALFNEKEYCSRLTLNIRFRHQMCINVSLRGFFGVIIMDKKLWEATIITVIAV